MRSALSFTILACLLASAAAPSPADAATRRRICRIACADEIQACVDAGEPKRRCRRTWVRSCLDAGVELCSPADAIRSGKAWVLLTPDPVDVASSSPNTATVTWTDTNTQETGYAVERSYDANGPFIEVAVTARDVTSVVDSQLLPDTTYYYRARAFKSSRKSLVYSWYSQTHAVRTRPNQPTTTSTTTSTSTTSSSSTTTTTTPVGPTTTSTTVPTNLPPVAVPGPDRTVQAGQLVHLDGSGSYDPDGVITAYYWDFGDGSPGGLSAQVDHAWTQAGSYTLRLWVNDDDGTWGLGSATVTVLSGTSSTSTSTSTTSTSTTTSSSTSTVSSTSSTVTSTSTTTSTSTSSSSVTSTTSTTSSTSTTTTLANQPPTAAAGPNQIAQSLISLTFDGSQSQDPEGQPLLYAWTFGDGSGGAGRIVTHAYQHAGTYTVTLAVADPSGLTAVDSATVTITNRAPTADAGPDRVASVGGALAFDGSGSTDPDGDVVAWSWSFGDGSSGTGANATHAYQNAGSYTVTLTVTDDSGSRDSDVAFVTVSAPTSGDWVSSAGGTGADAGRATVIAPDGTIVVAGDFAGTATFGGSTFTSVAGSADLILAKYTPAGSTLWARRFGAEAQESATSVAVDGTGAIVLGGGFIGTPGTLGGASFANAGGLDALVGKYSGTGTHLWSRSFAGLQNDMVYDVDVDSAGNVVAVGVFQGTVDFGGGYVLTSNAGGPDLFVAKLSGSNGATLWATRYSNLSDELGFGVAVDGDGNIVVTGGFLFYLNFGTGTALQTAGGRDVFVAKLRGTDGTALWSQRFGSTGMDQGLDVAIDTAGDPVIAGEFQGSVVFGGTTLTSRGGVDAFVVKLAGATGNPRWARQIGGTLDDDAERVATGPGGAIGVTGSFRGTAQASGTSLTSRGGTDIYFVGYDGSGNATVVERGGGSGDDNGHGVAIDGVGDLYVTGSFRGTADVLGTTLTSASPYLPDCLLLRKAP